VEPQKLNDEYPEIAGHERQDSKLGLSAGSAARGGTAAN
jgi:hypothetical protein